MKPVSIYAFADEASPWIDGQIEAMHRNNLQGLEIRGVDTVNISEISLQKAREIRKKLHDKGLIVWSIGSPIGKIPLRGDHAAHVEMFRRTLETAAELEAKNIRLFSYYTEQGHDPDVFRDEVMERMAHLLSFAEGSGICLCHENEKGIYGDNARRCRDLLDQFPQLSAVFDPANFIQCQQDTLAAFELLRDRIHYLHIKDALPDGTVVPAGHGTGHLSEIIQGYLEDGGQHMTVEPHLQAFSGLSQLGRQGDDRKIGAGFHFKDLNESFDVACTSLRNLLTNI